MSEQSKSAVESTEAVGTGGAGETSEAGKASEPVGEIDQATSTETAAASGTGGATGEKKEEPVVETKTEEAIVVAKAAEADVAETKVAEADVAETEPAEAIVETKAEEAAVVEVKAEEAAVAETKPAEPVIETKPAEAAASANVAPEPAVVSSPSIEVKGEELSDVEDADKGSWTEEEEQGEEEESEDERQTAEVVDSKPAPAPTPEPASPAPTPASDGQLRAPRGPAMMSSTLLGLGAAARPSTPKQSEHKPAAQSEHKPAAQSEAPRQEAPKEAEVQTADQPTVSSRQESSSVTKIGFAPAPEPFLPEGFEDFLRLVLNDPDRDLHHRVEDFLCVGVKELNKQLNKAARLAGGRLEARLATARAMLKTQLVEDEPNRKVRVVIMFFVYRAYLYDEKDALSCYRKAGSWLDNSLKELNAPAEAAKPVEKAPEPTDTETAKPIENKLPFGSQPTIAVDTPVRPTGTSGRPSNPEVVREQMSQASRSSAWDQPKAEVKAAPAEVKPAEPQAPPAPRQPLRKPEDNPSSFSDPFRPEQRPLFDDELPFFRPREEKKAKDEKRELEMEVRPGPKRNPSTALLGILFCLCIFGAIFVGFLVYSPSTKSVSSGEPTCEAAQSALLQAQLGQSDPAHYKDECQPTKVPSSRQPFVDCRNRTFHVTVMSKKNNSCDWDIRDCNVCYRK
ncbi:MAG: hypothetical protein WC641_03070 [Patescibacteria group bacterium]